MLDPYTPHPEPRTLIIPMPWSRSQQITFITACKAVGLSDEHRYLILSQCGNRAVVGSKISAASKRLNQDDFEQSMAVVEASSGGQVKIKQDSRSYRVGEYRYRPGHWRDAADQGVMKRCRYRLDQLVARLAASLNDWRDDPAGRLLAWIRHSRCITDDRLAAVRSTDDLRLNELRNLIDSLTALAKRHGVDITTKTRRSA